MAWPGQAASIAGSPRGRDCAEDRRPPLARRGEVGHKGWAPHAPGSPRVEMEQARRAGGRRMGGRAGRARFAETGTPRAWRAATGRTGIPLVWSRRVEAPVGWLKPGTRPEHVTSMSCDDNVKKSFAKREPPELFF